VRLLFEAWFMACAIVWRVFRALLRPRPDVRLREIEVSRRGVVVGVRYEVSIGRRA
jgi:hypothetical protein